jgi:hypothetical protein
MPGIEFVPGSKPTAADRYWWSFGTALSISLSLVLPSVYVMYVRL